MEDSFMKGSGARFLIVLVSIVIILLALWKMGIFDKYNISIGPKGQGEGQVSKEDWGNLGKSDSKEGTDTNSEPEGKITKSKGKLNRPIKVAINLFGAFIGGMYANDGFKVNPESIFTKKYGIEVEIVRIDDLAQSRNALKVGGDKGGVDILWDTTDTFAYEYESIAHLRPKAIIQLDWSRGADAIAVRKGINSFADLKGKTVSVAEGSPSQFFLLYALSQAGMSNKDIKSVYTPSGIEAADLFKAGKVDACVSWAPDVYIAQESRSGARILASTREATNVISDILVARGDFLDNYPTETVLFIKGWLEGLALAQENRDKAVQIMVANFEGLTSKDAEGMLDGIHLANEAENRLFMNVDGEGSKTLGFDEVFSAANLIFKKVGYIENPTPAALAKDNRFIAEATTKVSKQELEVAQQPNYEFKPETQAPVQNKQPILTQRLSIYFESGSATLDDNAKTILEKAADLAISFGSTYIRVAGNTDSVGSRDMNKQLSLKRAQAVTNYLINTYKLPRNRFRVVGNGPDKPVASNSTDQGKAKNRRTDFEIIPQ